MTGDRRIAVDMIQGVVVTGYEAILTTGYKGIAVAGYEYEAIRVTGHEESS